MVAVEDHRGLFVQTIFFKLGQHLTYLTVKFLQVAIVCSQVHPNLTFIREQRWNDNVVGRDVAWTVSSFPNLGFVTDIEIENGKKWGSLRTVSPMGIFGRGIPSKGRGEEIIVFLGVVGAIHALHPQMFREGFDAFRSRCRVQGQSCVFVNFAFSFLVGPHVMSSEE